MQKLYVCRLNGIARVEQSKRAREWARTQSFRCKAVAFNPADNAQRSEFAMPNECLGSWNCEWTHTKPTKADDDFLPRPSRSTHHTTQRSALRIAPEMSPACWCMAVLLFCCVAFGIFGLSEDGECQQVAVQHRQRQRSLAPGWWQRSDSITKAKATTTTTSNDTYSSTKTDATFQISNGQHFETYVDFVHVSCVVCIS